MTPKDKVLLDLIKILKNKGISIDDLQDVIVNREDISPQTKRNQIKLYDKLKSLV